MQKRKKRRRKPARRVLFLFLCCIFVGVGLFKAANIPVRQAVPELYSETALLTCLDDDRVLLDVGSRARMYPASMTKIMTAVIVLEAVEDLQRQAPLEEWIFPSLYAENAALAGFEPGTWASVEDLLYGLMLPSGAECALALAAYVAGSEEAFVALMNQKAQVLGMGGTHFANASGLHHESHYSTARDIAALFAYALQNEVFYEIITTQNHWAGGLLLESTLLAKTGSGPILGGKTGYTLEAGQCLASFADIGGRRYVLVTAGAYGNRAENLHIRDALAVYESLPV